MACTLARLNFSLLASIQVFVRNFHTHHLRFLLSKGPSLSLCYPIPTYQSKFTSLKFPFEILLSSLLTNL